MLAVDTVLQDRYRIVRSLGQGGMGAVYEAIDERLNKTVAVKEVLLELEDTSNETQKNLIRKAFRRGDVFELKGDLKNAIADYQKALKINPNYAEAKKSLARVLENGKEESP